MYPILTSAATMGLLCPAGDFLTQKYFSNSGALRQKYPRSSNKGSGFDMPRTLGYLYYGMICGPFIHVCFKHLKRKLGSHMWGNIKSTLLYELGIFPAVCVPVFYACTDFSRGRPLSEFKTHLREQWGIVATSNAFYWIPITFYCFHYVRPSNVVLVQSIAIILWNAYLSWLSNNKQVTLKQLQMKVQTLLN